MGAISDTGYLRIALIRIGPLCHQLHPVLMLHPGLDLAIAACELRQMNIRKQQEETESCQESAVSISHVVRKPPFLCPNFACMMSSH